ncbi:DMT family transporter [Paenibacillus sp. P96]|uniref:DMT family transporter n=1 Tax=Paenibacillus zeirhizosphaerae TaxID=2987519 RepID=A0ABT9FKT4_9BACL|nr:DMT family transporter [Paenibacillus sp. P96]MDP4095325.1 DMT family transporter [Paenibacillus sp. P96]
MYKLSRSRTAVYLAFLIIMWGVNWPLSKFALEFTPPLLFAGLRTCIAGLLLILIALPRFRELRFRQNWPVYLTSSLLNIVLFYGFQTIGLGYVPAGLFSAIVFLQPVLLGIAAWLWLGEEMSGKKLLGLLLGFLGVTAISIGGLAGHIAPTGILLAIGSAVTWTFGTVYMKKTSSRVDMLWMTAIQITIGGIVLLAAGAAVENWSDIRWEPIFVYDMLFISVFVIALGWLTFFRLIGSGEASKVGSFTFLIPLIAITCSVLFLGEHVTLNLAVGLVLIVLSILLVNGKQRKLAANSSTAPS